MTEELFNAHGWKIARESASLPDGRVKDMIVVSRPDSVHILAFPTPSTILMLREYRPRYKTHIWMVPSGRADKENDMKAAAQRELQEETGFRANHLEFYCTTRHSETLLSANHIFIARDLVKDPLPQDSDEMIEVHEVSLDQAIENVLGSEQVHTASAFALLRYAREHGNSAKKAM
ncbi:MAG: NUDIX hydrolase [Candidatus Peribacteraceae bacterium]|nr:NUDIX hydrolase [Candidatus Peribacteraceae bacterium]